MKPTHVLFVGATGSIGRYAVEEGHAQGYKVRALVRDKNRAHFALDVKVFEGDLTSVDSMREALDGIDGYDEIFLGYPLWWETAPRAVRTWLESHDFTGKKLITFATSSSSVRGADGVQLHDSAPSATWIDGHRVQPNATEADMRVWAESIA